MDQRPSSRRRNPTDYAGIRPPTHDVFFSLQRGNKAKCVRVPLASLRADKAVSASGGFTKEHTLIAAGKSPTLAGDSPQQYMQNLPKGKWAYSAYPNFYLGFKPFKWR